MSEVCGPPCPCPCPTEDDKISWAAYLDKNISYIKFAVLGTGFIGFMYAARSIRLMQTFRAVGDIPDEFCKKNFKLFGIIRNAVPARRPDSASMINVEFLVEHVPIAQYPRLFYGIKEKFDVMKTGKLPGEDHLLIRLPGVKMDKRYMDLIRQRSVFQRTSFVLLEKRKEQDIEYVLANIYVREPGRLLPRNVDLGQYIVNNGYGCVTPPIEHPGIAKSYIFKQYYSKLIKLEEIAAKKKRGIWADPRDDRFSLSSGIARRLFRQMQKFYFERVKKGKKNED